MTPRTVNHAAHRLALVGLLALVLGFGMVACGKKGDPVLPNGQKDQYPQPYPQNDAPQTGVFSN